MSISISRNNRKLGAIPSFSFPPVVTCRKCAACVGKCYALKMARVHPSVGRAWERNLDEWKADPENVKKQIIGAACVSSYFRFFVGGDIPDADFMRAMVEIAENCQKTRFLAFTKQYEIVNGFIDGGGKIPENLQIIFSRWGSAEIQNPHNLPESSVIFKGQVEPENAKICGGDCTNCAMRGVGCWELKSGETINFFEH